MTPDCITTEGSRSARRPGKARAMPRRSRTSTAKMSMLLCPIDLPPWLSEPFCRSWKWLICARLRRTGLLSRVRRFGRIDLHDVSGVLSEVQKVRHDLHGAIDMTEEGLVSGTEVVQALFAVRREQEAIARTLAITGESHFAFPAIPWKAVTFGIAKIALLGRCDELHQMLLFDIPEP